MIPMHDSHCLAWWVRMRSWRMRPTLAQLLVCLMKYCWEISTGLKVCGTLATRPCCPSPAKDVMYFVKFDITWFWIDDVGPLEYAAAKKIFNRMLEVGGKDPCHFIHPLQRKRSNQWSKSNQLDLCLQNIKVMVMWEALSSGWQHSVQMNPHVRELSVDTCFASNHKYTNASLVTGYISIYIRPRK